MAYSPRTRPTNSTLREEQNRCYQQDYGCDRIRITPLLVRVADETQLWAESYDIVLELDDVFVIQSRIAREVSEGLDLALLRPTMSGERGVPTDSMEAYNAYLRGIEADGGPRGNYPLAERMYGLATELDPDFALAWAGLGGVRSWLYFQGDRTPERRASALDAVDRARILAPDLPETHRAAGWYHSLVTLEQDLAYPEWEQALRGLPSDAEALGLMAHSLQQRGDWDAGVLLRERALRLDPRSTFRPLEQAWALGYLRRYEEAAGLCERSIALAPDYTLAYYSRANVLSNWKGFDAEHSLIPEALLDLRNTVWNATVHRYLGRYDDALRLVDRLPSDVYSTNDEFHPRSLLRAWIHRDMGRPELARAEYEAALPVIEAALRSMPDDDRVHGGAGLIHAGLGRKDEALRHGRRGLELKPPDRNATSGPQRLWDLAMIQAQVGEADAALDSLERVLTIPSSYSVHFVKAEGAFDALRGLPRYRELVERFSADVFRPASDR